MTMPEPDSEQLWQRAAEGDEAAGWQVLDRDRRRLRQLLWCSGSRKGRYTSATRGHCRDCGRCWGRIGRIAERDQSAFVGDGLQGWNDG
jgi:hypothetical protein